MPFTYGKAGIDDQRRAARQCLAERRKGVSKANVIAAMSDAEAATWSGGRFTYFEHHRRGFTVEPTTYRQLVAKGRKP